MQERNETKDETFSLQEEFNKLEYQIVSCFQLCQKAKDSHNKKYKNKIQVLTEISVIGNSETFSRLSAK